MRGEIKESSTTGRGIGLKNGRYCFFLWGRGCHTIQQNRLKPPQDQYVYTLKSRAQSVQRLLRLRS